jgi:DNA modification methylase
MIADMIEESGDVRDVLEYRGIGGSHEEYMGYAGQKPTDLLSWLILAMSEVSDTVLDPHMGSGSTLAASIPLCRESIGIEVDPERFNATEERIDSIIDELRGLKHAVVNDDQVKKQSQQPTLGDD